MKTFPLAFAAVAVSATAAFAASDVRTFDTNGDRFASFEEANAVIPGFSRSDFRSIDTNRDNRLSSVELQSAEAQSLINRYLTSDFIDLASVDTDGDNFVSFSELAGAYPGLSASDWRSIDGSGDGRLTANEFYTIDTQVVLDRSGGSVTDFVALDAVDADGSNFASFGELSAAFPGLSGFDFDDIDANGDNRVSFTELNDIDTRTILGRAQR